MLTPLALDRAGLKIPDHFYSEKMLHNQEIYRRHFGLIAEFERFIARRISKNTITLADDFDLLAGKKN